MPVSFPFPFQHNLNLNCSEIILDWPIFISFIGKNRFQQISLRRYCTQYTEMFLFLQKIRTKSPCVCCQSCSGTLGSQRFHFLKCWPALLYISYGGYSYAPLTSAALNRLKHYITLQNYIAPKSSLCIWVLLLKKAFPDFSCFGPQDHLAQYSGRLYVGKYGS